MQSVNFETKNDGANYDKMQERIRQVLPMSFDEYIKMTES